MTPMFHDIFMESLNHMACMRSCFNRVHLFMTFWTVTCQAPLSMGFSRQEHWSGLPFPPSGILHVVGVYFNSKSLIYPSFLLSPLVTISLFPVPSSPAFVSLVYILVMLEHIVQQLPEVKVLWDPAYLKVSLQRRAWHPTPVFLPRESHGQRSLLGYSP